MIGLGRLVLTVVTIALLAEASPESLLSAQGGTSPGANPSLGSESDVGMKAGLGRLNHAELLQGRVFEPLRTLPAARAGAIATLPEGGRQMMKFRLNQGATRSTITRSWRHRHPVLFAALVGTGAGVAFGGGLVAAGQNTEPGLSNVTFAVSFAPLGAGVGALLGYVFR